MRAKDFGLVVLAVLGVVGALGCSPAANPPLRVGTWVPHAELVDGAPTKISAIDDLATKFYWVEAEKTSRVASNFVDAIPPTDPRTQLESSSHVALASLRAAFGGAGEDAARGLEFVAGDASDGASATPTAPVVEHGASSGSEPPTLSPGFLDHVAWAERRLDQGLPPAYVTRDTLLPVTLREAELFLGDRVAVSFLIADGSASAFVVGGGESVLVELGEAAPIEAAAALLRRQIQRRDPAWAETSATLCDQVITPLRPHLAEATGLVVSGHAGLEGVPWAAVCTGEERLGSRGTIVELPSLTLLRYVNSTSLVSTVPRVVTFGNPIYPLPLASLEFAELEAALIATLIPGSTSYLGRAATETMFRAQLADASVVHLATHALAVTRLPDVPPGVFLAADPSNDGLLTTQEIVQLDMRGVELAVLSACESGVATGRTGVDSLSAAFIVAGARTTVTSLWSVDDQATSRLMVEFYSNLWTDGPARAMQKAQTLVASQPQWAHPYYWASFQVSGGL